MAQSATLVCATSSSPRSLPTPTPNTDACPVSRSSNALALLTASAPKSLSVSFCGITLLWREWPSKRISDRVAYGYCRYSCSTAPSPPPHTHRWMPPQRPCEGSTAARAPGARPSAPSMSTWWVMLRCCESDVDGIFDAMHAYTIWREPRSHGSVDTHGLADRHFSIPFFDVYAY